MEMVKSFLDLIPHLVESRCRLTKYSSAVNMIFCNSLEMFFTESKASLAQLV